MWAAVAEPSRSVPRTAWLRSSGIELRDERNQNKATQRRASLRCGRREAERWAHEVRSSRCASTRRQTRSEWAIRFCPLLRVRRSTFSTIASCCGRWRTSLKPGGRLLFTAPHLYHRAMSERDMGPFCTEETGWHVRRGYSPAMLRELSRGERLGLRRDLLLHGLYQPEDHLADALSGPGRDAFAWAVTVCTTSVDGLR